MKGVRWCDHKAVLRAMKREQLSCQRAPLDICTSLMAQPTGFLGAYQLLLLHFADGKEHTGTQRSCAEAGASCLLLIYHIWESNYRPHIFLSVLCKAISRMLRTMALLFPKNDTYHLSNAAEARSPGPKTRLQCAVPAADGEQRETVTELSSLPSA